MTNCLLPSNLYQPLEFCQKATQEEAMSLAKDQPRSFTAEVHILVSGYVEVVPPPAIGHVASTVSFVRDVEASADFYEKKLGFRRDPNTSGASKGTAVAFLSYPIPFAVLQAPPGVNLDAMPRPITAPSVWFKASNIQVVHDSLVASGVTILRSPTDGRFGRQFTFVDPDGYAITMYDRDAPPEGWENAYE
jgi:predicted enzyme related to lactoylglutathione lyase